MVKVVPVQPDLDVPKRRPPGVGEVWAKIDATYPEILATIKLSITLPTGRNVVGFEQGGGFEDCAYEEQFMAEWMFQDYPQSTIEIWKCSAHGVPWRPTPGEPSTYLWFWVLRKHGTTEIAYGPRGSLEEAEAGARVFLEFFDNPHTINLVGPMFEMT